MSLDNNPGLQAEAIPEFAREEALGDRLTFDRRTLRFRDPGLERQFWQSRFKRTVRQLRISLIVAAVANFFFLIFELQAWGENAEMLVASRMASVVLFAAAFAISYTEFFVDQMVPVTAATITGFALIYTAINAVSGTPELYMSGYMLAILFGLNFIPLGFPVTSGLITTTTLIFAALIPLTREVSLDSLIIIYTQFVVALMMGMVALYWLERLQRRDFVNHQKIAAERARYHELLNQILPSEIVERLEKGEREIADEFAASTVLFADIVGFTEVSERHKPAEVLLLLNRIFGEFDVLVDRHGVEKIKTNGDAYMAAGGLPQERPGHCEASASLALDMLQAVKTIGWPDGTPVQLRIGIHSGPLIAGVIGNSRFIYDLWGDTVNTASRMESHGQSGHIQVSSPVRDMLGDAFTFEPHGETEIKGKGTMKTWFLTGKSTMADENTG